MATQRDNIRLAEIARRLAATERELVALRGERRPGRRGRLLGVLATGFVVLNPGSIHNGNISVIADAGITKGYFDTQHYCPNDLVTRERMASFLARTAGLGGNPPIANAVMAQSATTDVIATNAAQLGGVPASGYLRPVDAITYHIAPATMYPIVPTITKGSTVEPGGARIGPTSAGDHWTVLPLPVPAAIFGNSTLACTLHIARDSPDVAFTQVTVTLVPAQ